MEVQDVLKEHKRNGDDSEDTERKHFFSPEEDVYLVHFYDKYPRRHWAMLQDFEDVFASNRNKTSLYNRRNKLIKDALWIKIQGLIAKYGIEEAHKHYHEIVELEESDDSKTFKVLCDVCMAKDVCCHLIGIKTKVKELQLGEDFEVGVVKCKYYR